MATSPLTVGWLVGAIAFAVGSTLWVGGAAPVTAGATVGAPDWSPCDGAPGLECAWLDVPLDHADPNGRMVSLPMRRLQADSQDRRSGVLVTIAGGPGQRGTDHVRAGAHPEAIEERFDIVSWDPRGTGGETDIGCIPAWDPFVGVDRTPDTATERRLLDTRIAQLARRCRIDHGDVLPFLGTIDSALDLERLRQALGEERISILASSYGTRIAATYATLFPERVRAIVLDGYSDPDLAPDELEIIQAAAFERELDEVLDACAVDLDCPFHQEGQPAAALDRLLDRLDARPIPIAGPDGQATTTQSDAYEAILGSLVAGPGARDRLLSALADAAMDDGSALREIAQRIRQGYESTGLDQGTFMATYCADTAAFWRDLPQDELQELTARITDVAPRLGPWLWSVPAASGLPPVGLCAMATAEPVTRAGGGPTDAAGVPVLVLGTSGDPTTPIGAARDATDALAAGSLLTLDADHHLAYTVAVARPGVPAHRCVLDAVAAYLIEGERPADGTVCH